MRESFSKINIVRLIKKMGVHLLINAGILLSVSYCNASAGDKSVVVANEDFLKLINPDAALETVAGSFAFTEGPVWSADGYLYFSDIPAGIIRKWSAAEGIVEVNKRSGNANGLTIDNDGRLLACEHGNRRLTATDKDGKVTVLASKYQGKRLNSPNDVVVKSNGSIYFTDPPYGVIDENRELDFQGIYMVDTDGKLRLLNKEMKCPNGLAFSPDEKILYVVDSSDRMHIKVFDVKEDGSIDNSRIFASFDRKATGPPDGMRIDIQGNVWTSGPGGIWVFNKNGVLLGRIMVPQITANCAWGDDDGKTLYITASTSVYRIRTNVEGIRPWIKKEKKPLCDTE